MVKPIGVIYWVRCPQCRQVVSSSTIPGLEDAISGHAFGHVKLDGVPLPRAREVLLLMLKEVLGLAKEDGRPEAFMRTAVLRFQLYVRGFSL